jgi:predicted nucleotidyltransferase
VDQAVRRWFKAESPKHGELIRLAYFGSYARGDWGVGSDLDLVAVVSHSDKPFGRRALDWNLSGLPVPADLLVYTEAEWNRLMSGKSRLARTLELEAIWIQL